MATLATLSSRGTSATIFGDHRIVWRDVTFSNSYTTGGESITPDQLGLIGITQARPDQGIAGLLFFYDYTNQKLKAMYPTGGATSVAALGAPTGTATGANAVVPAGGTTVTSTAVQPTLTITQPTVALAGGQGREVAASTDLSTVTVRVMFIGK